jgi:ABC-2 type transport system permease protein
VSRVGAFLLRGWLTEISYRTAFVLDLGSTVILVATMYFVSQVVGAHPDNPHLRAYGGNYLVFVVVGIVFQSLVTTSLAAFSHTVRGEQIMGTLEFLFLSPTPLWRVLIYAALWDFLSTILTSALTLGVAVALFGVRLHADVPAALSVLGLTVVALSGIGLASAGIILVTKQGDPVTWFVGLASGFLGGVMFPVQMLPTPLARVAMVFPTTHALEALRRALIAGDSIGTLAPALSVLALFCGATVPIGLLVFYWGFRTARRAGSLSHY